MKTRYILLPLICLILSVGFPLNNSTVQAGSQASFATIDTAHIIGGFESPVHITNAGDGSGRLFVVEQRGRIKIIKNNALLSTFLDITDRVRSPFNLGGSEEGLLSVAFPPGFGTGKPYFYVYYTLQNGNNRVSRFTVGGNPDLADPSSERIILDLAHPTYGNHNGGQLAFGPDGYLYIGTGDGGGGGDPNNNAQNPGSLLGKLLRIDVEPTSTPHNSGDFLTYLPLIANNSSGPGYGQPYLIPPDNPFIGVAGYRDEIWALGLRNPWRFSFDRLTGDLFIGDVGQNTWEEVDYQPAASPGGENYGWNIMEGMQCYNSSTCDSSGLTMPVFTYRTNIDGNAVTGGYVYRGSSYPGLQGTYFVGDYSSGKIWGLQNIGGLWQNQLLLDTSNNISSFGEDEAGELYFVDISTGDVFQIIETISGN